MHNNNLPTWSDITREEHGVARVYRFPHVVIPTGKQAEWERQFILENAESAMEYFGASQSIFDQFIDFLSVLEAKVPSGQPKDFYCHCTALNVLWQTSNLDIADEHHEVIRLIDLLAIWVNFDNHALKQWLGIDKDNPTDTNDSTYWECYDCNGTGEGYVIPFVDSNQKYTAYEITEMLSHTGFNPMMTHHLGLSSWANVFTTFSISGYSFDDLGRAFAHIMKSSDYDEAILTIKSPIAVNMDSSINLINQICKEMPLSYDEQLLVTVLISATGQSDVMDVDIIRLVEIMRDQHKFKNLLHLIASRNSTNPASVSEREETLMNTLLRLVDNGVDAELGSFIFDNSSI